MISIWLLRLNMMTTGTHMTIMTMPMQSMKITVTAITTMISANTTTIIPNIHIT